MSRRARQPRLDGAEFGVTTWGRPRATGVVLLHGFLSSSYTWRSVASQLERSGHYVVALELPGSGECPSTRGLAWTADLAAELLERAIDKLGFERFTLVGTQMGGSIAAWFAARRPAGLERLVIMAAGALGETSRNMGLFRALSLRGIGPMLCRYFPAQVFRRKWLAAHGASYQPDDAAIDYYLECFRRTGGAQAALALGVRRSYGARFDRLAPLLASVEVPTLLIWGEDDHVVPLTTAERFARALPRSTLVRVPGCGDFPQEEAPEIVAEAVASFIVDESPPFAFEPGTTRGAASPALEGARGE